MSVCAFIGDEVSAAGFRLAGIDVHVPVREEAVDVLRGLLGSAELILITAEVAESVPEDILAPALRADHPLTLVVADARDRARPPDLAALMRRQLGMAD